MRLVLFDIDGTLVDCGPRVRRLFGGALEEVFGTAGPIDDYDFSGKTDPQIARELLAEAGVDPGAVGRDLPAMKRLYLDRLDCELTGAEMRLLPAVVEVLDELAGRGDVRLGLLTGNWEAGAWIKLGRVGLEGYFEVGAYGDGQPDRMGLPGVAMERARKLFGRRVRPGDCLIVGDSQADVACARRHGIPALAVATGRTPAERLQAAGAHWVVPDLGGDMVLHPAFGAPTP